MATLIALILFSAVIVNHAEALTIPTLRTMEAQSQAGKLQSREALLLSPIVLDEIGEGKPLLILDLVLGHAMVLM